MGNIVSYESWIQIIIQFEHDKLNLLKLSQSRLYILQGIIGTNPSNSYLSFGGSIALNQLTSSTTLNILVDHWPFRVAADANRGSIPCYFSSDKLVKQSLVQNFFEVDSTGSSSPKINFAESNVEKSQNWDNYTLGLSNKSDDLFYIGLGRAFQWSQEGESIDYASWESMIGCNCFLELDSHSSQYWHFSNEIILLISSQQWNNGYILPQELSGYVPCYFKLKERKTIRLYYDDNGWRNLSTGEKVEFKVVDEFPLNRKTISDLLIHSLETPFSPKKPPVFQYGNKFYMRTPTKKDSIVSAKYESLSFGNLPPKYYYPQINSSEMPIQLLLSGGNGILKDGDTVRIETTEQSVGNENILGAWTTPSLYYETDGWGEKQLWTIRKKNNNEPIIYYGDEVYFVNHHWTDQWLCIKDSGSYLTTKKNAGAYWLIDQP
ncbi:hypothetical protein [Nostoc sp. CALU 546]|uniref:hypothetical protein n=1 Tax=Nostoc sp. CALU 546 TaxID=1867241 RepID=UPI003B6779B2